MNYIYDIYLNFHKNLYDFYDWNKNDKIIHLKMIPIFKISEKNLKTIINHSIKLDKLYLSQIINKAIIFNKKERDKNYVLFCDENNIIAIEFDNHGNSVKKSSLIISEELEILETAYKIKTTDLKYRILDNDIKILKTRKEIEEENFICDELKNINIDKLNYVYFECFGKQEKDKKTIIKKLLNIKSNSKTYKNLYNILKLTSACK